MPLSDYTTTPEQQPRNALYKEQMRQLGELEYFAELANAPSGDPWATLGTKVAGAGVLYNPLQAQQAQYMSKYPRSEDFKEFIALEGKNPAFNTIYTGFDRNVAAVQNHEFRHAATEYIRDNYTKDDFIKRWGEEAGAVYNLITQGSTSEGSVETFDRPQDPATGQSPAFGGKTMEPTIQFVGGMPQGWTDALKRQMGKISEDIMGDLGVPPRAKPRATEANPWADKSGEVSASSAMDILKRIGELESGMKANPENAESIKRLTGYLEQ